MSQKELLMTNIVQELNLIPENYLVNLLTIIHTFRENIPVKAESANDSIVALYGSWKGEETAEELIDFIYSSRTDTMREAVL